MTDKAGNTCDWCGAEGVVVAWPVPEIRGVVVGGSVSEDLVCQQGTWAACVDCRPLVEAHNIDGLLGRADARYGHGRTEDIRARVRPILRALFAMIDQVRGEAVSVSAWPEWVR